VLYAHPWLQVRQRCGRGTCRARLATQMSGCLSDTRPGVRSSVSPRGMTLVELLVAVAIIGVLMAALLPAVQAARAAARRTACSNNLRNIGCSLHGHLLAHEQFPVGCLEWRGPRSQSAARCFAWSAAILPWLEEQALHNRIDFSKPFDDPVNGEAAATEIAIYRCPSADDRPVSPRGRSDYGGLTGERIASPNNPEKGPLVHDQSFAARDISDGLSKTIFVGECSRGPWPDGEWINGRNLFDQAHPVNWETWEDEIRSNHAGGAMALFGDGSVRLIQSSLDRRLLAAFCTRAGKDPAAASSASSAGLLRPASFFSSLNARGAAPDR